MIERVDIDEEGWRDTVEVRPTNRRSVVRPDDDGESIANVPGVRSVHAVSRMKSKHRRCLGGAAVLALAAALPLHAASADDDANLQDPFANATHGLAGCPVPERPHPTPDEVARQAHGRSQRGASCYLDGRCRLPNAYLYDREIVPRVVIATNADERFATTSVWVLGSRRWVWLKGCVSSREQRILLEERVRRIDDVEQVIDQLMVGTTGPPSYETVRR